MNLDSDECCTAILYSLPLNEALFNSPPAPTGSFAGAAPKPNPKPVPQVEPAINPNKYQLLENVNYGAVDQNLPEHGKEKYYLSTAIAYTNGYPHIGHAYEVYFTYSHSSSHPPLSVPYR
jgi:hypothetical protein